MDFIEGHLPEEARGQVAVHLASPCPVCQAELESIKDLIGLFRGERLSEPSRAVVDRAIRLYRRVHERPRADDRLRWIARPVFDSRLMPGAAAARGSRNERQVLYRAEGFEVDLQISPETGEKAMRLMGQVMTVDDDPSQVGERQVRLVQEEGAAVTATTDELGTFAFRAIPPGDYELWIDLAGAEVWIPSLNLGLTGAL